MVGKLDEKSYTAGAVSRIATEPHHGAMIVALAFIRDTDGDFLIAPFRKNVNTPRHAFIERQTVSNFL